MRCEARIRHPGVLHTCTVEAVEDAPGLAASGGTSASLATAAPTSGPSLRVRFDKPVRSVAPLQSLALYDGQVCLGGATIAGREGSLWEELTGAGWRVEPARPQRSARP